MRQTEEAISELRNDTTTVALVWLKLTTTQLDVASITAHRLLGGRHVTTKPNQMITAAASQRLDNIVPKSVHVSVLGSYPSMVSSVNGALNE